MTDEPWPEARLGDIADLAFGATPSRNVDHFWDAEGSGYLWASIADLRVSPVTKTAEQITRAGIRGSSVRLVKSGTPLMSFKLTIGRVAMAGVDLYTNEAIVAVRGKAGYADDGWLFHALPRIASAGVQDNAVKGNTLNKQKLENLLLRLPSLPEQQRIARILDVADDTIRSMEQLIAKVEQIKQGLLRDLLTRGTDSSGVLRADSTLAPGLYRDSQLGRIPAGWTVSLLDDVAARGSGHTPNKDVPAYWNGGIRWVSLADSAKLDAIYIAETDKEISELGIANSSAVKHRAGTVILSRDAGVGKSAILAQEMAVSQHFMAWTCGASLDNHYLYYWLQFMKPRFEAIAMGSTIKTIGLPFFRRLLIALPPIDQQRAAAAQLLAADADLARHRAEVQKQRLLKQGLIDDLLTGRVRVGALG